MEPVDEDARGTRRWRGPARSIPGGRRRAFACSPEGGRRPATSATPPSRRPGRRAWRGNAVRSSSRVGCGSANVVHAGGTSAARPL